MAHYDKASADFIKSVSGDTSLRPEEKTDIARTALRTLKSTIRAGQSPQRAIAMAATKVLTDEVFSKTSSLSIIRLYDILNDNYSKVWWEWEPETLWKTLQEEHSIQITDELKNAVQALQLLVTTFAPMEHWHIFEKTGHAFEMEHVDFATLQPLELDVIAKTMKIINRIRPNPEYDDEIYGYIAASAKNSGVVYLPPDLFGEKSQSFLDTLNNDLELKRDVARRTSLQIKPDDSLALKVQLLRLKEIRDAIGDL